MAYIGDHDYNGTKIKVSAADFSTFMRDVVTEMESALKYTANDTQKAMIQSYIEHFQTGW
jgi:dipeptidyl-peptidase-3